MGILHIHIKNIGDRKNHSSADALAVMQGTVVNNVGWLGCHFTLVKQVVISMIGISALLRDFNKN